jgi:hypothetical protein
MPQIKNGLSVFVYTQLSNVEDEINGLVTYDRKVIKMPAEKIREINNLLFNVFQEEINEPPRLEN